ncbi:hypothetical protein SAMN05444008_107202 [Cnuella takakiae]|uniref:Uncharacterized protein n=1 Tax=Cnuella takakiae TaxID=1302690 RepID=A0A1M5B9Y1_9BACT|nr:hypothetical protein [Cnuella takakiae]OLY93385.1 hypothetical protein BUE76_16975 [Cnuella takakiae]SHF38972.1 hypothetical protein SAMN05444008_107202 [Cnuella takakiae]
MRVLLVGDFSAVHSNLAKALRMLGHDVVVASTGDNFKNFQREYDLKPKVQNKILAGLERIVLEEHFVRSAKGFDVIQIVNPGIFSRFHLRNPFRSLLKRAPRVFMYAVGDDYRYWQAFREKAFRYSPHADALKFDYKAEQSVWEYGKFKEYSLFLEANVSGIITGAASYQIAYQRHPKYLANIPFPVYFPGDTLDEPRQSVAPMLFIHGRQSGRHGFKGSWYIDQAISLLEQETRGLVQFRTVENLPFTEYLHLIKQADGIFDQANCYDPGMNALINMMHGRLVFGGCEPEFMDSFGIKEEPLVNIIPDPAAIAAVVRKYVNDPGLMYLVKCNGSRFVQKYHNSLDVAEKFVSVWNNVEI